MESLTALYSSPSEHSTLLASSPSCSEPAGFNPFATWKSEAAHENHPSPHACGPVGRQYRSLAAALLHQPHGPGCVSQGVHGEFRLPQLAIGGGLHGYGIGGTG